MKRQVVMGVKSSTTRRHSTNRLRQASKQDALGCIRRPEAEAEAEAEDQRKGMSNVVQAC